MDDATQARVIAALDTHAATRATEDPETTGDSLWAYAEKLRRARIAGADVGVKYDRTIGPILADAEAEVRVVVRAHVVGT